MNIMKWLKNKQNKGAVQVPIKIWGNRTLSTQDKKDFINIRKFIRDFYLITKKKKARNETAEK